MNPQNSDFESDTYANSVITPYGAGEGSRTLNPKGRGILSPLHMPILPLPHIVAVYSVLPLAIPLHILLELSQVNPLYSVYAWTIKLTVSASSMTGSLRHSELSISTLYET